MHIEVNCRLIEAPGTVIRCAQRRLRQALRRVDGQVRKVHLFLRPTVVPETGKSANAWVVEVDLCDGRQLRYEERHSRVGVALSDAVLKAREAVLTGNMSEEPASQLEAQAAAEAQGSTTS